MTALADSHYLARSSTVSANYVNFNCKDLAGLCSSCKGLDDLSLIWKILARFLCDNYYQRISKLSHI